VTGKRILVVDDSPTQVERLRLLLLREGYRVDTAPTGQDGLTSATASPPDLIISDVTMPGMDGFDFCRAMKSARATRAVPFILLTSRSSPADIIIGLECGADNFIPKPYEDDHLLERIRRVFAELEYRKHDRLDMQVVLTVNGRKITVTADRQQIVELLFATIEQVSKQHDQLTAANRELHQARTEADRANGAKSQFLSRVSHEIRTPLHAILGYAQLLETADLATDEHNSVAMILTAGQHLLNIINDLLDIGRIEENELGLAPEPIRIVDILRETIELLAPLAADRGITTTCTVTADGPHVTADRQRLKQVLINLLSNAIKYNTPHGTVTLNHRRTRTGRACIDITDTGPGIAPQHLSRLFAPFDRLEVDRTGQIEGTGLGLALSRRLVTAMGGTLGVDSHLGSGSTFWVELPLTGLPDQ
jgi:two-component system, sensor histidine kinase and response regulator